LLVAAGCACAAVVLLAAVEPAQPQAAPAPPGRLQLVGHSPLQHRGMNAALAVHGDYAYVGSRTDGTHLEAGVQVVDVSRPSNPRVVGEIGRPAAANPGESSRELRVWPEQDLLVVMNFACDAVGHLCLGSLVEEVPATFRFYDISGRHARQPRLVATYRVPRNPHEFFLWDDPAHEGRALLYITTPFTEGADIARGAPHLLVTDISRAREGEFRELVSWSPEREERWDEAALHSLSVSDDGTRAYLADLEGGFAVADTSELASGRPDPDIVQLTPPEATVHHESPGAHSALPLPGRPYALITDEVYGEAFGAAPVLGFNVLKGCPWGWMRTIEASDPAAPREAGEFKVLPWNDPAACPEVSPLQDNGASFSSHNITVTEHLALVSWHSAGLQVASLADPEQPRPAASFQPRPLPLVMTEDPALSLTEKTVMWSYPVVKDGLIYVVDLRNGLYVLRYRGPFEDEVRCAAFLEGNSNVGRRIEGCPSG
jgi:hypothetical protein